MGASGLGDQRAPPSPFPPEPPELEPLAPELVLEPPELEPLDPLEPEEPLDAPDHPPLPELAAPEPEPLDPVDASDPASMPLVSSEKAGAPPPLPPEHPTDKARQPMRGSGMARTRTSSVVMDERSARDVPDFSNVEAAESAGHSVAPRNERAPPGDNQKMTLTCAAMRRSRHPDTRHRVKRARTAASLVSAGPGGGAHG